MSRTEKTYPSAHPARALARALLIATAAWAAAPALAAKDPPAPIMLQPGPALTAEAAGAVALANASTLKGVKRVAVTSFTLVFVSGDVATAAADKTSMTVRYELQGVGPADFQALTDQAYGAFLDDLRTAGYDVVGAQALTAQPAFAKLQGAGQPSGTRRDGAIAMSPAGLTVPPLATTALVRDSGLGASLSTFSAVGSTIAAAADFDTLARGLDATLLDVTAVIDFAELKASGGGMLDRLAGNNAVSVAGKPSTRLTHGMTTLRWFTPAQQSSLMTLERPLLLPADTIAEVTKGNSDATTAGNIAGALLSAAIGGGSRHKTQEYQAIAKPETYRLRVGDGLAQLRAVFIGGLNSAR